MRVKSCPGWTVLEAVYDQRPGVDATALDHVRGCPGCRARLSSLDDLASLARQVPVAPLPAERRRELRERILLQVDSAAPPASALPDHRGASRWAIGMAAAVALLVIGSVLLASLLHPSRLAAMAPAPPPSSAPAAEPRTTRIAPDPGADYRTEPDGRTVVLTEGRVHFEVRSQPGQARFRVLLRDAEVVVKGTVFAVSAHQGHLVSLEVSRGLVEVLRPGRAPALVPAGEVLAVPSPAAASPPAPAAMVPAAEPAPAALAESPVRRPVTERTSTRPAAPARSSSRGGAGESGAFARGLSLFEHGNFALAARQFAAERARTGSSLAEDALFWEGASWARAGQKARAVELLERYVAENPEAGHAAEAYAIVGWHRLEAGDRAAAETHLRRALSDGSPVVKKSAADGLSRLRSVQP
jgi:TolA-binding protein